MVFSLIPNRKHLQHLFLQPRPVDTSMLFKIVRLTKPEKSSRILGRKLSSIHKLQLIWARRTGSFCDIVEFCLAIFTKDKIC